MVANINSPKPKEGLHPQVKSREENESHGKETGLVKAPIVSVNPSSGNEIKEEKQEFDVVDDVLVDAELDSEYPFGDLEPGQGFFVPATEAHNTDELVEKLNKEINAVRMKYAEVEKDENGDEILEVVTIKTRKRNDDGTIQLENGKPIVGANQSHRPKYIYARNFVAKPVVKDDELNDWTAENDGVMVIRVV